LRLLLHLVRYIVVCHTATVVPGVSGPPRPRCRFSASDVGGLV
jgi:hypothetical protein